VTGAGIRPRAANGLAVSSNVDYRLLERFLAAQRRNTEGRYDAEALNRLRTVVELRRHERARSATGGSVVPLPLDD
jgi:hypothetical protein